MIEAHSKPETADGIEIVARAICSAERMNEDDPLGGWRHWTDAAKAAIDAIVMHPDSPFINAQSTPSDARKAIDCNNHRLAREFCEKSFQKAFELSDERTQAYTSVITDMLELATDFALARRASPPSGALGVREEAAEIIYDAFPFEGDGAVGVKPRWVPGGNSLRQDDARRAADKVLALGSVPPHERAGWRPIETAPDDDTEILISGFDPDEGEKSRYVSTGCKKFGHYYQSYWSEGSSDDRLFNPTHWMPLPAFSPAQSQEETGHNLIVTPSRLVLDVEEVLGNENNTTAEELTAIADAILAKYDLRAKR